MKKITIGIVAHVDSGKTTLSEAFLYQTGTIRNFGRVDKGASFLDNNEMERRRGITIYSKQARFSYGNTQFTLIDTPGHADFSAEMERALQVLDYAVLLISAADGIKGQTETLWRLLKEYRIPVFVFFNKMDQKGTDKDYLLRSFRASFADNAVDFSLLLSENPEEFHDQAAMCSEEAMEAFLETGSVPDPLLRQMIRERKLIPVFFGSALKMEGVTPLLDALDLYTLVPEYPEEFGARVYKIMRDEEGARLTLLKITGGVLQNKSLLPDGEGQSKINQIRLYNGLKYELADMVKAGEVCAVSGLKESYAGEGFGRESEGASALMIPILSYRVILPDGMDPLKALPYFRKLEEENPELKVEWDEEHQWINVCVMGEVQLEILTAVLKERFDLSVTFDSGEVMYRETIKNPMIGAGHFEPLRHFAEVFLLLEPLQRGSGLSFASMVSSDVLAKNWQRLVLTHLSERRHRGVLTGSPVTDLKITLIYGRAHLKHTEGGDFRQAVYRAVRQGLMMAENVLLEPYYRFTLEIPSKALGRAMTDLERMGASFSAPETAPANDRSVLKGRGPVTKLKDYPKEIAAYTKGEGRILLINDGYDECMNPEEVIARKSYDPLADVRNSPDSVFCAHGAGYLVPYDEVLTRTYLPGDIKKSLLSYLAEGKESGKRLMGLMEQIGSEGAGPDFSEAEKRARKTDGSIGTDEVNAIIEKTTGSNRKTDRQGNNWKRKFGVKDYSSVSSGNAAGQTPGDFRSERIRTRIFSLEEAEIFLIDGYNVIFAWQELSDLAKTNIDSARDALIDLLTHFRSLVTGQVIVVFDAYRVKGHAMERMTHHNIEIVYTAEEQTADQFIEKFTNDQGKKNRIAVVTSDYLEQMITRGQGCILVSSRDFKDYYNRLTSSLRERYNVK